MQIIKPVSYTHLDETSSQELGETLESYVNNGLGFLEQTQFSAKLSLKAMFPEGDNAVSYTHLDVYKRQIYRYG